MTGWPELLLAVAIGLPLAGGLVTALVRLPVLAGRWCAGFVLASVLAATAASLLSLRESGDRGLPGLFAVDEVAAPLLPAAGLLHLLAILGTAKAFLSVASCVRLLLSASMTMAALTCQSAGLLIALLLVALLLPVWDLGTRGKGLRGLLIYLLPFAACLIAAWMMRPDVAGRPGWYSLLLVAAVLLRGGIVPLHSWQPALFRQAGFGTAVLFLLPLMEVLLAVRLVLPVAPGWLLEVAGIACLVTAVICGGLAMVQENVRRFFALLCLSQTSLVLFGVMEATPASLTAALCLWSSTMLALGGLGFSIRALEARYGELSLNRYHGCYDQVPEVAICFFLTGLASVGFPGTIGFLPMELLISGSLEKGLVYCLILAFVAMLNAVAIMRGYFALFTGTRRPVSVSLRATIAERGAMVLIALTIVLGGWFSPTVVEGRHRVAEELLEDRPGQVPSPRRH